jgi:hypothetical protein
MSFRIYSLRSKLTNISSSIGTLQSDTLGIKPTNEGLVRGIDRGISSVDLQTNRTLDTQVSSGNYSTLSGGSDNIVSGDYATISGGFENVASNVGTFIGGGNNNTVSNGSSSISGGSYNTSSGFYSSVLGGYMNTASGHRSSVLGGNENKADGSRSVASGNKAEALHDGAFVFADDEDAVFASTVEKSFNIRAENGIYLDTASVDTTATTGVGELVPANIEAYLPIVINNVVYKIPLFND